MKVKMKRKKINFKIQTKEDELIDSILEEAAEKSKKNIQKKGVITLQDAIPLLLRGQFNHIKHLEEHIRYLEENMVTKDEIKNMATKDEIKMLKWMIGFGIAFISLLVALLSYFLRLK
jgi:aspartate ammonia-lyase